MCNNCVIIGIFNDYGCQILKKLNETGNGFPCSSSDIAAGRYVQAYWTSPNSFLPGIKKEVVSDGLEGTGIAGLSAVLDHYCCDFDGCNKPGLAPQATCMATKTTFSASDYCSGITIYYKLCIPIRVVDPTPLLTRFSQVQSVASFDRRVGG